MLGLGGRRYEGTGNGRSLLTAGSEPVPTRGQSMETAARLQFAPWIIWLAAVGPDRPVGFRGAPIAFLTVPTMIFRSYGWPTIPMALVGPAGGTLRD